MSTAGPSLEAKAAVSAEGRQTDPPGSENQVTRARVPSLTRYEPVAWIQLACSQLRPSVASRQEALHSLVGKVKQEARRSRTISSPLVGPFPLPLD